MVFLFGFYWLCPGGGGGDYFIFLKRQDKEDGVILFETTKTYVFVKYLGRREIFKEYIKSMLTIISGVIRNGQMLSCRGRNSPAEKTRVSLLRVNFR